MPEPTEVWLSDPDNLLRKQAETLCLNYENQLGVLDLTKVVFFRVLGHRDLKKKGCTWRLMPPYNKLLLGAPQLLASTTTTSSGELIPDLHPITPDVIAAIDIRIVIAIYDDHHSGDSDRMHTLLHELYHIAPDTDMLKLRDHDVKDFSWLIQSFGLGGTDLADFDKLLEKK